MKSAFRPRARLLQLLGEQLIGTSQLAIFELVKNSYDADADKVIVEIKNPKLDSANPEKGSIEVTDFGGEGMDYDVITNVWLEPGADHKKGKREKRERTKKYSRLPLGEKGVGRFAVHKLGKHIKLTTKAENSPELSLEINWEDLLENKYIDETSVEIKENNPPEFFKDGQTGTRIVITDLNKAISDAELRELYRNIKSILSPFENSKYKIVSEVKGKFDVQLLVPGREDVLLQLVDFEKAIDQSMFRFMFFFKDGKWEWQYEFKPFDQLQAQYNVVPKIKNSNGEENMVLARSFGEDVLALYAKDKGANLGEICGEIHAFHFGHNYKDYYADITSIQKFVRENGGIRVYRDNVRVYNYGEASDDWLGLDSRRVARLTKGLNKRITLGAISLSLEQTPDLVEKTNREGFVENDTYKVFQAVVLTALSQFEELRVLDKNKIGVLVDGDVQSSITEIEAPLNALKEKVKDKGLQKDFDDIILRIEKSYNSMRDIMLTAGLSGLNMSIAFHEIYKGVKWTRIAVEHSEDRELILEELSRFQLLLDSYATMLKQEKAKDTKFSDILKGAQAIAKTRFRLHNIVASCPVLTGEQKDYEVNVLPNKVSSVINNLIDNAIYWLDTMWGTDVEGKKLIYFGTTDEFSKGPAIIIGDNGPGWRNIDREDVVKPFHTTKPGGMGIGLYYSKVVMEMLGGELLILNANEVENVPDSVTGAVVALVFKGEI